MTIEESLQAHELARRELDTGEPALRALLFEALPRYGFEINGDRAELILRADLILSLDRFGLSESFFDGDEWKSYDLDLETFVSRVVVFYMERARALSDRLADLKSLWALLSPED